MRLNRRVVTASLLAMALSGALYADLGDRAYAAMALAAALGGVLVLLARSRVAQPRR